MALLTVFIHSFIHLHLLNKFRHKTTESNSCTPEGATNLHTLYFNLRTHSHTH